MTVLRFPDPARKRMCAEELRSRVSLLRYRAMTARGGVTISRELAEQLADHLQATSEGTDGA